MMNVKNRRKEEGEEVKENTRYYLSENIRGAEKKNKIHKHSEMLLS